MPQDARGQPQHDECRPCGPRSPIASARKIVRPRRQGQQHGDAEEGDQVVQGQHGSSGGVLPAVIGRKWHDTGKPRAGIPARRQGHEPRTISAEDRRRARRTSDRRHRVHRKPHRRRPAAGNPAARAPQLPRLPARAGAARRHRAHPGAGAAHRVLVQLPALAGGGRGRGHRTRGRRCWRAPKSPASRRFPLPRRVPRRLSGAPPPRLASSSMAPWAWRAATAKATARNCVTSSCSTRRTWR